MKEYTFQVKDSGGKVISTFKKEYNSKKEVFELLRSQLGHPFLSLDIILEEEVLNAG